MSYSTHDIIGLQKSIAPKVYGDLDLTITPERFRTELGPNSTLRNNARVQALLADDQKVELFRQLTLMGDPIADAYAAKIPELGFRKVNEMLDQAIEHGIDSVENAPEELKAFVAAVDTAPEWLDYDRVERGARIQRPIAAISGDFIMRVAFMNTYVNGYQGLPMIITGALTSSSAGKRMAETSSTFKLALLPGAMKRGGEAYRSVLKVRLMHAMVRCNLLNKKDVWDFKVYGVPIPQVDQMGAALVHSYLMAKRAVKKGRGFSEAELDVVELGRYLAYLLGMHDQFLSNDPAQIIETWEMCQATLRHKHDPRGKQLNEATLAAYRRPSENFINRAIHFLDVNANKLAYRQFVGKKTANEMGVEAGAIEAASFATLMLPLSATYMTLRKLDKISATEKFVEKFTVKSLRRQLHLDGKPEYKTDASNYAL